jgi:pimeloyl-ACP methyl ester carboxylesterase
MPQKKEVIMKPDGIAKSRPARWIFVGTLFLVAIGARTAGALAGQTMELALVEPGIELEYTVRGTGEPVVLVHAGLFAEWFRPLLEEPALTGRYRVLSFHRVGYARSSRVSGPVSIARQAAHVRALMGYLGIGKAHIVGHSSGGNIALQLALDAPEQVQSLSIPEPALPVGTGSERLLATRQAAMRSIIEQFQAGNKAAAVDGFMRMVSGPAYRAPFEQALPGAFDRGLADSDTFFGQELPAIQQWQLKREDGRRITQPVLAVVGEKSLEVSPIWDERQQLLLAWLPNVEAFVLPGTTHLLHVQSPRAMAEALTSFFARHPIAAAQ